VQLDFARVAAHVLFYKVDQISMNILLAFLLLRLVWKPIQAEFALACQYNSPHLAICNFKISEVVVFKLLEISDVGLSNFKISDTLVFKLLDLRPGGFQNFNFRTSCLLI